MIDVIQVVTTTSSREESDRIARTLVERRLAACVQVAGPIESTYHWQGKVETSQEWICTVKTRRTHYPEVEDAIRQLHSYEVPEILAFDVTACSRGYWDWLRGELADFTGPEIV